MKPPRPSNVACLEIGCGSNKRTGFFGIDIVGAPGVDLVLDVERQPLPFADDSIEHIFSSHTFEHFAAPGSPVQVLREIMRVAKHGALIEIWTPYIKNDAAFVFGHTAFYSETIWQQVVYLYDTHYFGDRKGRCLWEKTQYVLRDGIVEKLRAHDIELDFAMEHMFNIVEEFGVFLRVDKRATKALSPQSPRREFSYGRDNRIDVSAPHWPQRLLRRLRR